MKFKYFEHLGRELRDAVLRLLRDYSEALGLAVLMAIVLRLFIFSAYKISNPTMEPNLKLGDFFIGYKLPYGFSVPFSDLHYGQTTPRRGDVVIFKCPKFPDANCVKRVVGLPGDRIEIRGQRLWVNGRVAKYKRSDKEPSVILTEQARLVALEEKGTGSSRHILVSDKGGPRDFGPYVVPPGTFFALGDNRDFSEDSRHWGAVPIGFIESRALFIWLSIEWLPDPSGKFTSRMRWKRIFSFVE